MYNSFDEKSITAGAAEKLNQDLHCTVGVDMVAPAIACAFPLAIAAGEDSSPAAPLDSPSGVDTPPLRGPEFLSSVLTLDEMLCRIVPIFRRNPRWLLPVDWRL